MKDARSLVHAAAAICLAFPLTAAAATSVLFEVHDVADTLPGEDRWQYRYFVSGTFHQFDELSVLFDSGQVSAISAGAAPNSQWTVVTLAQPDAGIPADGIYAAMALVDNPSLTEPFVVDFVRTGGALPGAQRFEVLDASFNLKDAGITIPVPEPASYALLVAGLAMLGARRFLITPR